MPHKTVAIVVAMRREVAPLLRGQRPTKVDAVELFESETAVIAVGGIGRIVAQRAADVLVAHYAPSVIVSAGIAGALTEDLKVGEVVQAREIVDANSGERWITSGGAGTIATVSSVSGAAEKRILAQRWNADVVDMEASAVAQVAKAHGIEFAAIKAISDEFSFAMPPVGRFVDQNGKFQTLRFAAYLAVHPKSWNAAGRLQANSRVASLKLSVALQLLIDQWSQSAVHRSNVEAT